MPTTTYGQTTQQRDTLRRQLLDFARGSSQGAASARYFTKQDLIDHGVNDLVYPEPLVRAVVRELEIQRLVLFHLEATT